MAVASILLLFLYIASGFLVLGFVVSYFVVRRRGLPVQEKHSNQSIDVEVEEDIEAIHKRVSRSFDLPVEALENFDSVSFDGDDSACISPGLEKKENLMDIVKDFDKSSFGDSFASALQQV